MNYFAIGSHLKVARMGYAHHGIYIGAGQVIHYAGFCEAFRSAPVEIATLAEFQGKAKKIDVVKYENPVFTPEEIVARAKSRLSEDKYSLIFNNCEHFAHWCITNNAKSKQVYTAISTVGGILGLILLPSMMAQAARWVGF